jgi:hypothetical protein
MGCREGQHRGPLLIPFFCEFTHSRLDSTHSSSVKRRIAVPSILVTYLGGTSFMQAGYVFFYRQVPNSFETPSNWEIVSGERFTSVPSFATPEN